ncbi:MAG: hypothetical protein N4A35_02150 [Flavobacteriales bacterium]|jgi:hypothetical protein|nr:hypothetical protein [Flavobacteriales bacterium]
MKFFKYISLLILLLSLVSIVYGQPAGGGPPGGPAGGGPPCWPPPCIPVDGGISFLLAIGAAYGAKKAYQNIKEES